MCTSYCNGSAAIAASSVDEAWIVEVEVAPEKMVLFQALVQAEEGLAVVRCRDPNKRLQQLWTTQSQREELIAFLSSLPASLRVRIVREWPWRKEAQCADD